MFTVVVDYLRSARTLTDQGFLKVPGRFARVGIQEYYAYQVFGKDAKDPMKIVRVYRPEEEVFHPDSMASFEDNPITIDHPPEGVDAKSWKQHSVGHVRNLRRDGIYLVGDMTIADADAIKDLDDGKIEISNGYKCKYILKAGVTPGGEAYDAIQTNIRGNHVALVDAARCGPACRVFDSQSPPSGAIKMGKKITVDGVPVEVTTDTEAAVVEKLVTARDGLQVKLTKAETDLQNAGSVVIDGKTMTLKECADALVAANKLIDTLKKDAMTPEMRDAMVAEWSKMLADAARIAPKVKVEGKSCAAVRREIVVASMAGDSKSVLEAIFGGVTADKATDDQIKTAFNVLAVAAPAKAATTPATDAVEQALAGKDGKDGKKAAELDGRDAYLHRTANAWDTSPQKVAA